ncbi:MAG TPA: hypothetical protein VK891_00970 [Euzebyales bacterium]|nr:hypothetical protein [Euzebyales bacterium]
MARGPAAGDVARAVERMTNQQRSSLGALLSELDTAEELLVAAEQTLAQAQMELAAARAVKQRRLDAIETLIASIVPTAQPTKAGGRAPDADQDR